MYQDVNVTTVMPAVKPVRVCNTDWASFAAFDRVAVINGSVLAKIADPTGRFHIPEPQVMGMAQLLQRVDATVTLEWLVHSYEAVRRVSCAQIDGDRTIFSTPNGTQINLELDCCRDCGGYSVTRIKLEVLHVSTRLSDALQMLPAVDLELIAALRSFPYLNNLVLWVGSGTLLPQLGALTSLRTLTLHHHCLRGPIPVRLLTDMPNLLYLTITPVAAAVGAVDPARGLCGVSGTLPDVAESGLKLESLDLSYNRLTGQLPLSLLLPSGQDAGDQSVLHKVSLQHNTFSGSIPGCSKQQATGLPKLQIDLSDNALEVMHCPVGYGVMPEHAFSGLD
jgi:hypothetical protein